MKRREFITLLGGAAAAWPLAARAQQPAMPVIGFLSSRSPGESAAVTAAFHRGLQEAGYREGHNVHIAFRWAEGRYETLPTLAAELVQINVAVIFAAGGNVSGLAAKAATTTVPIVSVGSEPDRAGLVASFNRPGGNVTAISVFSWPLTPKRLELLRELVPAAEVVGVLINSNAPAAEMETREVTTAARTIGQQIEILNVTSEQDIHGVFATLVQQKGRALVIGGDAFLDSRRELLVALAAQHALPTIYPFAAAGGLISYSASIPDAYRQGAIYVGRILKGEKPADNLPVLQPTKFELLINLKTAKALRLTVPPTLLARADEVIE